MPKQYHIGLIRSWKTVIVNCSSCLDSVPPGTWRYIGCRVTTKARLQGMKDVLLKSINLEFNTNFERIIIN